MSATWSPHGDGVKLWDVATGDKTAITSKENIVPWSAVFSPNGQMIATGGAEGKVVVFDVATRKMIAILLGSQKTTMRSFAFSPDNRTLAAVGHDGASHFWDIETASEVRTIPLGPPDGRIYSVAYDATGRYLLTSNGNASVYVLRLSAAAPHAEGKKSPEVSRTAPQPAIAPFDSAKARAYQEAWADSLDTTVETTNSVGMKLTLIPPGEFLMGSTDKDVEDYVSSGVIPTFKESFTIQALPQHQVTLTKPFRIGQTEVTVGQFRKFVESSGYKTDREQDGKGGSGLLEDQLRNRPQFTWKNVGFELTDDFPVGNVTWHDAVEFCNWLSLQENLKPAYVSVGQKDWQLRSTDGYRLPTEAEWEYACRAGTTTAYYFGDNWHPRYGWTHANTITHPVGTREPNAFGLFDMAGNAEERVQDWAIGRKQFTVAPATDPTGPDYSNGRPKITRGGGVGTNHTSHLMRSDGRNFVYGSSAGFWTGFRVARVLRLP